MNELSLTAALLLIAAGPADWVAWKDGTVTEVYAEPCVNEDLAGFIRENWKVEPKRAVNVDNAGKRTEGCHGREERQNGEEFFGVIDVNDRVRMKFSYPA